ncbi:MAG: hypothetical protein ISR65_18505 [Bacteriovoracaceae bacterium]|nr:hypothetical protein [candidate division KSB1 bacterium]MBL6991780.1 hypothetical protein [Bacteriovoracaceae bacterium]
MTIQKQIIEFLITTKRIHVTAKEIYKNLLVGTKLISVKNTINRDIIPKGYLVVHTKGSKQTGPTLYHIAHRKPYAETEKAHKLRKKMKRNGVTQKATPQELTGEISSTKLGDAIIDYINSLKSTISDLREKLQNQARCNKSTTVHHHTEIIKLERENQQLTKALKIATEDKSRTFKLAEMIRED